MFPAARERGAAVPVAVSLAVGLAVGLAVAAVGALEVGLALWPVG